MQVLREIYLTKLNLHRYLYLIDTLERIQKLIDFLWFSISYPERVFQKESKGCTAPFRSRNSVVLCVYSLTLRSCKVVFVSSWSTVHNTRARASLF